MSVEANVKPQFSIQNDRIRLDLEPGYYIDMTPDMADALARKLLTLAAKARGEHGHLFVIGAAGD